MLILIVIILYFILDINDPYAKICIPHTVKNLNVKVFNLMTLTNETRHIKWHETCEYNVD